MAAQISQVPKGEAFLSRRSGQRRLRVNPTII